MQASGRFALAQALEAAVTHDVWRAARAKPRRLELQLCPQCGIHPETLLHRHWTCSDIATCTHEAATQSQHLVARAAVEPHLSSLWLGWVLPAGLGLPKPPPSPVYRKDCVGVFGGDGDFVSLLRKTWLVGLDGSGGKLGKYRSLRAVRAGYSVIDFGATEWGHRLQSMDALQCPGKTDSAACRNLGLLPSHMPVGRHASAAHLHGRILHSCGHAAAGLPQACQRQKCW